MINRPCWIFSVVSRGNTLSYPCCRRFWWATFSCRGRVYNRYQDKVGFLARVENKSFNDGSLNDLPRVRVPEPSLRESATPDGGLVWCTILSKDTSNGVLNPSAFLGPHYSEGLFNSASTLTNPLVNLPWVDLLLRYQLATTCVLQDIC